MDGVGRRRRKHPRRPLALLAATAALVLFLSAGLAAKPHGENVHRPDGNCRTCHTLDAAALNADRAAAKTALVPDLEARCNQCHSDEGPSHKTGIPPKRAEPDALPLAPDGTITCATCHFIHGEDVGFGHFLRLDNRRGGLCLSCHELSELQ
jgi:hypothetical protein